MGSAGMNTNSHIDVNTGHVPDEAKNKKELSGSVRLIMLNTKF